MKIVVPIASFVLALLVVAVAAGSADVYLHHRHAKSAGLNIWGYRGPVLGEKQPGELRVAVLGGSTAFGFGVLWPEAFPARLEHKLNERRQSHGGGPVSVANLAFNNEGAYSYKYTLRDYDYLDYDVVLMYVGYNDLGRPNTQVYRHQFPTFRLAGYVPILPVILREKALAIRYGGDLKAAYEGNKTAFRPSRAANATATTLNAAAQIADSLERQLNRFAPEYEFETDPDALCVAAWDFYCRQLHDAIALGLSKGARVLVVADPFLLDAALRERQIAQRTALEGMLEAQFRGRGVAYLSLGDAIDMTDASLQIDGMHLTIQGNDRIAEALVQPVLDVMQMTARD
jgi:hypothetical protein